ncbi:MAG: succinate dehydrogenase assembly factor 2 [Pseudomonadales bacterium]
MLSDLEFKRIYWHSRRGMLELDLVLVPFVENHLRDQAADDQALFVALLEEEDTDLFHWFLRSSRPEDTGLRHIVELILKLNTEAGLK